MDIPNAVSSSYTTPAMAMTDNGAAFRCVVSNSAGSVTSNAATLTVKTRAPAVDCKFGACGPADGTILLYIQYTPPTFPPAQANCTECLVYYDRDYYVVSVGDSLKGMKSLPSMADAKTIDVYTTWLQFKTDVPITVYIVGSTQTQNWLEKSVNSWLTPNGWTLVSNGGNAAWAMTDTGSHSGGTVRSTYDCVWKKTGTDFALNGQGNIVDPKTGYGGQATYWILIDAATIKLDDAVCQ